MENIRMQSDEQVIKKFVAWYQISLWLTMAHQEGNEAIKQSLRDLAVRLRCAPVTFEQNNRADPSAWFHYQLDAAHWYVTELDVLGGLEQAVGFFSSDGIHFEAGYISISKIIEAGALFDLDFTETPISMLHQGMLRQPKTDEK